MNGGKKDWQVFSLYHVRDTAVKIWRLNWGLIWSPAVELLELTSMGLWCTEY